MVAQLRGFWSYSDTRRELDAVPLHAKMQFALSEAYSRPDRPNPHIFFSKDPNRGIPGGQIWPSYLVDEIAKSALFFWLQSARWLQSPACRFEYEVARARMKEAARTLCPLGPQNADVILWQASLCPIRVGEPADSDWDMLDARDQALFRDAWRAQRDPMLDIVAMIERNLPVRHDHGILCAEAAPRLMHTQRSVLKDNLGIEHDDFLDHLARSAPEFTRQWQDEALRRFPAVTGIGPAPRSPSGTTDSLMAQRRLADRVSGGQTKCVKAGLAMLLVPDKNGDDGFWMTEQPLRGEVAERLNGLLPSELRARTSAAGDACWSAAAVATAADILRRHRLFVPNAAQAKAIDAIVELPPQAQLKLGLWGHAARFWRLDERGLLATSEPDLPLFLTSEL